MTTDLVRDYLGTPLHLELDARQHFRLLRNVFALVFASSVVIHLLVQQDDALPGMLFHATMVGLLYTVAIGLATMVLYGLRNAMQRVHVWHLWSASLAGFVLGYYILPLEGLMAWPTDVDTGGHMAEIGFLRMLPVWFVVTYLLVQPYLNEGLRAELARLRDINALLESRDRPVAGTGQMVHFESGRTAFELDVHAIRNIVVDDHYCYVHYQHEDGYAKRDLALPLREVLALLPPGFVQVHRSHVINPGHVASLQRKGRSIRVLLDGGYEAPVSRHRLDEVLPLIQQQPEISRAR